MHYCSRMNVLSFVYFCFSCHNYYFFKPWLWVLIVVKSNLVHRCLYNLRYSNNNLMLWKKHHPLLNLILFYDRWSFDSGLNKAFYNVVIASFWKLQFFMTGEEDIQLYSVLKKKIPCPGEACCRYRWNVIRFVLHQFLHLLNQNTQRNLENTC